MASKDFITDYGTVTVRNAMFESDNGTDLYEGIELKTEYGDVVEIEGYRDIDGLSVDDVEELLENNQ